MIDMSKPEQSPMSISALLVVPPSLHCILGVLHPQPSTVEHSAPQAIALQLRISRDSASIAESAQHRTAAIE
jgi:hypothetical protein